MSRKKSSLDPKGKKAVSKAKELLQNAPLTHEAKQIAEGINQHLQDWLADDNRRRFRVDPRAKHDETLSREIGLLLFGNPTEEDCRFIGMRLVDSIQSLSPLQLKAELDAISKMKAEASKSTSGGLHRKVVLIALWDRFKKAHKRDIENLTEFRCYVVSNTVGLPGIKWPSITNDASWGTLMESVGLGHKRSRSGKRAT